MKNRLIQFIITLFLLSVLVFYMARLSPGNPLRSYYGESVQRMSEEEQNAAKIRLGLDKPIHIQYVNWLKQAVKGDFGISFKYKKDVVEVIKEVYPATLILGSVSFVLTFGGALLLGVFCVMKEDGFWDIAICKMGVIINCIPEFWLAIVLILIFSINLRVLPSSGAYGLGEGSSLGSRLLHLILPVTVLTLSHVWYYGYIIRNRLLEEVRKDYVLLCKSKGLKKRTILFRHCVKNILPFIVSLMAVSVPHLLGGTYIVEKVFSYPGLGTVCFESAKYHDYNMLMIVTLITGTAVITINMGAQVLMAKLNPEMENEQEAVKCE